jgi:hypothetical protein
MGNSANRDKVQIKTAENQQRALELRRRGLPIRQISAAMGMSKTHVHRMIQDAIALIPRERAIEVQQLELERIDKSYQRAEQIIRRRLGAERANEVMGHAAEDGTTYSMPWLDAKDAKIVLDALDEQRKCRVERSKYLGLYAPEKVDITGSGAVIVQVSPEVARAFEPPALVAETVTEAPPGPSDSKH